jgi:LPS sulfotransferase NodH
VFFQGRTGSTFLIDSLANHPEIIARDEILFRYRDLLDSSLDRGTITRLKICVRHWQGSPAEQQIKAVKHFYDRSRPDHISAIGFKTKVKDVINLKAMKEVLESRKVKAIFMERKNLVKQAISNIAASHLHQKTGMWNLYDEKNRLQSLNISSEDFDRRLQKFVFQHKMLRAYMDWLNVPKLRVEYADLLRDKTAWFGQIFDFLCVTPCDLSSKVRKNSSEQIREMVTNFEELKQKYVGTEFEQMFDEVVLPKE